MQSYALCLLHRQGNVASILYSIERSSTQSLNKRIFMLPWRGNKVILERSASLWQSAPSGKLSEFELVCCKKEGQFPGLQRLKQSYKILLAFHMCYFTPVFLETGGAVALGDNL